MRRAAAILPAAVAVSPLWAQDLPDGPDRVTAERVCSFCDGPEMFAGERKSGDDWDRTITSMTTDKGLPDPRRRLYGGTELPFDVPGFPSRRRSTSTKFNINKVPACQLINVLAITVLAITVKQADAIVAYRVKNGDFKDLDGVKKVDGLDAATQDAKKDKIQF